MAKKSAAEKLKPDWTRNCEACGTAPVVPVTGLCGPCTFGEADTAGGNWEWKTAVEHVKLKRSK